MSDEPRLEEQVISEAAQMTISTQLDEVEDIQVDVRTDLLKIVQGQVDSVSIAGQGLVMQKDIRVQEMELRTNTVAINPLRAVFGQIELDQPVDANVRLVLTEEDINRALKSDYLCSKLQSLDLNVDGQIVTLEPQQLQVHLPGESKLIFKGTFLLDEISQTLPLGFTGVIRLRSMKQPLLLESFHCTQGEGISLELAFSVIKQVREWLNLPFFEFEEMALHLTDLEVLSGNLILHAQAYVRQLPDLP
jgi:hypothetical protein